MTFFLRNTMIADWVWYRYDLKLRRSVHDHGMMKLELSLDILDLVSIVYSRSKSIAMLQCAVGYHEMSDVKKMNFAKYI